MFIQNVAAVAGFRREGVSGVALGLRLLPATLLGSWLGAWAASSVPDAWFARAFGVMMLLALPVILRNPRPRGSRFRRVPYAVELVAYFGLGFYGGAFQAGIGIPLLLALAGLAGLDLVRANSVKVVIIAALTAVALAQFVWAGKVLWGHGLVLAIGSGLGGYLASRIGARVGDRLIRPVLTVAVIGMAVRLLWP